MNTKNTKTIGKIGEDVAATYLEKHGYKVIARNYYKKWGEIDIIVEKEGVTSFVEVKSITQKNVNHETKNDIFRPEDNIHRTKLKKLARVIRSYMMEYGVLEDKWNFMALMVRLNMRTRNAKVYTLEGIVL